jgi:hypothetical protein
MSKDQLNAFSDADERLLTTCRPVVHGSNASTFLSDQQALEPTGCIILFTTQQRAETGGAPGENLRAGPAIINPDTYNRVVR